MNNFQTVDTGKGLLKNSYDPGEAAESELSQAIRRRKEKLIAMNVAKDDESPENE